MIVFHTSPFLSGSDQPKDWEASVQGRPPKGACIALLA